MPLSKASISFTSFSIDRRAAQTQYGKVKMVLSSTTSGKKFVSVTKDHPGVMSTPQAGCRW